MHTCHDNLSRHTLFVQYILRENETVYICVQGVLVTVDASYGWCLKPLLSTVAV